VTAPAVYAAAAPERHFFRCVECCNVYAIEGESRRRGWGGRAYTVPPAPPACDCGAAADRQEHMGKVGPSGLSREFERCACDGRCTDALGPRCDCHCGGKNHGTHRVVRTVVVDGLPRIDASATLEKRLAGVEQVRAAREAALARIRAAYPEACDLIARGERVPSYEQWLAVTNAQRAVRKAAKLATIAGRVKALGKVCAVEVAA
jgi:hypothetical protein